MPVFQKGQYEQGEAGNSPGQAGKEVCELVRTAESVYGCGASLDFRHYPGDEQCYEKGNALANEHVWGDTDAGRGLRTPGSCRVNYVANNVDAVEDGSEQGDEEQQAPAKPQAVFAEEGPAERCGLRGGNRCPGVSVTSLSKWRPRVTRVQTEFPLYADKRTEISMQEIQPAHAAAPLPGLLMACNIASRAKAL